MSVLVIIDGSSGKLNKAAFEAVSYGNKILANPTVLVFGDVTDAAQLGDYGASSVHTVSGINLQDSQVVSRIIFKAVTQFGSKTLIFTHDLFGKANASRVAAKLNADSVTAAIEYPNTSGDFTVKRSVFSGKAFAEVALNSEYKVISISQNSLSPIKVGGSATVAPFVVDANMAVSKVKVKEQKTASGEISLPEAELVVSAGRGMKAPENWNIVEDLAKALGAATACSRPVSDIGWRPHHEHVGQTGLAVAPNLYVAIGISGAIQHLAGVNRSKVIVVINKDPEAPFFKAADYGIVGDAFEVLPKITEAVKKLKASAH